MVVALHWHDAPLAPGALPTGALPTGALPTGALPTGALPTGALPTGALPTGALPTGAVPLDPADRRPTDVAYRWRTRRHAHGVTHLVARVERAPGAGRARAARVVVARGACASAAWAHLVHDAEFRIALHARDAVFVHAGVVGWRGRALLLPGRSHAGKSTLVRALLDTGATYLSDEWAPIRPDGRVAPFPRALHPRDRAGRPERPVAAADLGAPIGAEPLPVGAVARLTWTPGLAAPWAVTPLSPGACALALVAHAVAAERLGPAAMPALARAVAGEVPALGWTGARGDAPAAARALLAACAW